MHTGGVDKYPDQTPYRIVGKGQRVCGVRMCLWRGL